MQDEPTVRTEPNRWIAALAGTCEILLAGATFLLVYRGIFSITRALLPPAYRGLAMVVVVLVVGVVVPLPRLVPTLHRGLTGRDRDFLRVGSLIGAGLGLLLSMSVMVVFGALDFASRPPALWAIPLACVLGTSVVTAYLLAGNGPSFRRQE
jgi:hypothetical protein